MEASQSSTYFRSDVGGISLLSVPDLESLEEITDDDVQELLYLISATARDGSCGAPTRSGTGGTDVLPRSAPQWSLHESAELPQSLLGQAASFSSTDSGSGVGGCSHSGHESTGTAPPLHSDTRRDPARPSSIAVEFVGVPSPPASSIISPPMQTGTASMAGRVGRSSSSFSSVATGLPLLQHVSDAAVLDAERQRWGVQLVQECWMHQELHNVRWNEHQLLKHGAAYRPRAIAARTAVRMTHTKSLCIALNVNVAIIENAGEAQVAEGGEAGASEYSCMPSMNSPEAEGWSPLLMWRSPALTPGDASTVLTHLSECLSEQYEGLAPRPLPTSCCANARPSYLVQTLSDARKDAGEAKVIFHYLARGVPPPRGGNLYLMNTSANAGGYAGPPYSKLSLETFRNRVGFPLVFIADCAEAREILNYYIRMCEEQHQQRYFTSSREYQLKSSRQVSAAELDNLVDGPIGAATGSLDRVGSGADLNTGDNLRRGRGLGGTDDTPPAQSSVLQDFYFIGATGSSGMGSGGAVGSNSLRDKSMLSGGGCGGGGYDDFDMGSNNLSRPVFAGGGGGVGAFPMSGDAGALRHHVRLPSDILTSCLTTPLRIAVLWFIAERPELQDLHPLLLRLFPGELNDKKTPLGQLQWYLQSIIECIAWSTLSLSDYSRLFREDVYVAPLFRGYILAERIIVGGLGGCLTVYPPVAPTHSHTLWSTWDNLVERACVSILRAVHPAPPRCANVLEFRGWLDEQVTSWKYTRPDLLATTMVPTNGTHACLPSTPDETAVFMPSLLTESLRGMQAQLDGITQQSFERPRVFFAEFVRLQLPSSSPPGSAMLDASRGSGVGQSGCGDESNSGQPLHRQTPTCGCTARGDATAGQRRPDTLLLLRNVADEYRNSLRSSYPAQRQQWDGGAFTPDISRGSGGGVSTAVSAASMGEFLRNNSGGGGGNTEDSGGRGTTSKGRRAMQVRADSQTALPTCCCRRTSQGNITGVTGATSPATAGDSGGVDAGMTTVTPPSNPAAIVFARMAARRSPSRLSGRNAEYVANLYTNSTAAVQATSFQYTAGLVAPGGTNELFMCSPTAPLGLPASASPSWLQHQQQHTFPFMDRMPLLLQALLVAVHREKATELVCRLVDCGPAAVLQCAEANIYRFVLDRYWSRPDLRFLMPATLFIYCKSCYADPELIGNAKQRDVAVKACAEILQSPVKVPPLASTAGVTVEEEPGAWQNSTLGPYATPYGQRLLAAALLTLIALHSDDGREACHRYGVFQLCCQLLQCAREDAPLLLMRSLEAAAATGAPSPAPSMPPLPRPPSSTMDSNISFYSPQQAQSRAADNSTLAPAGAEEAPPPPCIATTYHVTLLTLFVSLLCNWKPANPAPEDDDEEGGDNKEGEEDDRPTPCNGLSLPLDGKVHQLPPTTAAVLTAGLQVVSTALLNFIYSDTSILRGAALRCFMIVLISPAPSQLSRSNFVEVALRFIEGETSHRRELNTDLRLEELAMAYTTFRWLLDQLREDLPIEEIGQYVAVWIYKWFRLNAQGRAVSSPFAASGGHGGRGGNGGENSPVAQQQQEQRQQLSTSYQPAARTQSVPPTSMSCRESSVVNRGSVYSHRCSNVQVPTAWSVYGGAMHGASGGGVSGGLVNAIGSGLRQHLTQQDHRRLQACLPPLSNIVRIYFEHTQDACPYIRTYARKVVTEEFGFLHQSWYGDYAVRELRASSMEEGYDAVSAHRHHHQQPHQHIYGVRQERNHDGPLSGDAEFTGTTGDRGVEDWASPDPLKVSSVDGGGDLTIYLPLREMLSAVEVFDDSMGGPAVGSDPSKVLGRYRSASCVHPHSESNSAITVDLETTSASAPALMRVDIEDVPDPQPAELRRFIGRLLSIASASGPEAAGSFSPFRRSGSRHRLEGERDDGMMMLQDDDDSGGGLIEGDGDDRRGGYWRGHRDRYLRSASEGEGSCAARREGRYRHDSRHRRGSRRRHCVSGERDRDLQDSKGYYSCGGDSERDLNSELLDSDTLALHPLWAVDSTSMTNFAYGALSFLERFMLEKMDDNDPRHPMNLEKENALHHYYQRVERNLRAFGQDEVPSVDSSEGMGARLCDLSSTVKVTADRGEWVNDATSGGCFSSGAAAVPPAPMTFHYLGVGHIGNVGIPGYSQRRSGQRNGGRGARSSEAAMAEGGSRVIGSVDVVLFHPSEPLIITSTTGGLLSVWSYDHLGLPTTNYDEEGERSHSHDDDDDSDHSHRDDGEEGEEESGHDGGDAEPPRARRRSPAAVNGSTTAAAVRRLHAKAQFFLRDVVGRSRSDLCDVACPRFMYDRFNPNVEVPRPRGGRRCPPLPPRSGNNGCRGIRGRDTAGCPGNFCCRNGMAGGCVGGRQAGAWIDRAEAANAIAALPSSYRHGRPHFYHGVGNLHLVDAAYRPLICAVRRFGAVEVFSHFTDRHRVRRVVTFETARLDQNEGMDQCVSDYQSCTGLLYVSNGSGGVSAWDLGNEQRMATLGMLAGTDSLAAVGASSVSALKANPYTPYEYLVGSYGKKMCLFDLRDGGGSSAARLGCAHPSSSFTFTSSSSTSRYGTSSTGPLSPLCVRVCYPRRYPNAVVAGYACGTVAVWDRRYPKRPSLLFGNALNDATTSGGGTANRRGYGGGLDCVCDGSLTMIRQLDVHSCSKRFLTLTTTPTTLQLLQLCQGWNDTATDGGNVSGSESDVPLLYQRRSLPAFVIQNYDLVTSTGDVDAERVNCEPRAACFHEFSPVLCVGTGGSVRLYGTSHLSTMATYMDVDGV